MQVEAHFVSDVLRGNDTTEMRVTLLRYIEDELPPDDEWCGWRFENFAPPHVAYVCLVAYQRFPDCYMYVPHSIEGALYATNTKDGSLLHRYSSWARRSLSCRTGQSMQFAFGTLSHLYIAFVGYRWLRYQVF